MLDDRFRFAWLGHGLPVVLTLGLIHVDDCECRSNQFDRGCQLVDLDTFLRWFLLITPSHLSGRTLLANDRAFTASLANIVFFLSTFLCFAAFILLKHLVLFLVEFRSNFKLQGLS